MGYEFYDTRTVLQQCITDDTVYRLKKDIFCEKGKFTKGTTVMLRYVNENCLRVKSLDDYENEDLFNPLGIVDYQTFIETFEFDDNKSKEMREIILSTRKKDKIQIIALTVFAFVLAIFSLWILIHFT